jgi:hypothetical protein
MLPIIPDTAGDENNRMKASNRTSFDSNSFTSPVAMSEEIEMFYVLISVNIILYRCR